MCPLILFVIIAGKSQTQLIKLLPPVFFARYARELSLGTERARDLWDDQ